MRYRWRRRESRIIPPRLLSIQLIKQPTTMMMTGPVCPIYTSGNTISQFPSYALSLLLTTTKPYTTEIPQLPLIRLQPSRLDQASASDQSKHKPPLHDYIPLHPINTFGVKLDTVGISRGSFIETLRTDKRREDLGTD
jgi:hypothetical protein